METIHGLNKNGPAIISTGVIFTVLAVGAVGLRFASKRITKAYYAVDDWTLLASLIVYFTAEILVIRCECPMLLRIHHFQFLTSILSRYHWPRSHFANRSTI